MKISKFSMALITAASLLAVSPAVYAQTNETGGTTAPTRPRRTMSVDARMKQIDEAVTLTDAQKPKVKAALEEQRAAVEAALQGDESDRRSKFREAREALNKKMKDILTPEQYTKYEAMPRPGRRGGAGGGGGGQNQ